MKALKYLNKYFIKYKFQLILGLFITVLAKIFALFVPQIIGQSIDIVTDYKNGVVTELSEVKTQLMYNILYIIGAALVSGAFTFLMRQLIIVTSRKIEFDLKNEIFQQYELLSLNFYKKHRTGDLMNRINEDVSKVRMYFGPAIMYSINMVVLFIVAIVEMVKIDLKLTLYTMIPFPVLSISIYYLSKMINERTTVVQQYLSHLTTIAQEKFSGISIIKSYGIEPDTIREFEDVSNTSKDKNIHLYKAQALFFPMMILLIGISNIIVIYVGGMQYISGRINLGTIAEFLIYVNMLTWPVAIVGWVTSIIQQAEASQKRINEFLHEVPEIQNNATEKSEIEGDIVFDHVTYTYDDTKITALKDVSFHVKKGETIGILGKTGSGKSTILNLVSRLYDVTEGEIQVDQTDIKQVNLGDLRENIGFVPQEAFLFSDTIENNIKFGDEEADEQKVIQAAKDAYVHHNIEDFKEGYQTYVGERGVTLSGGQKQRISIARAIIKNPQILIFDDCLSAVDTETEEKILNNLYKVSKDKTTFIVSHRISSVKHADQIIVLEEGKIIQRGNHETLLKKDGFYKELYEQQLMEKEF
ncbi:ABC transporter ATP-binding protein [Aureivirga sp. CE67]|uniref:ABC transporter ATP-binding protein n=1 Tax=Aureivirga sp. CE67 TaxID=1788983 RepID=UPI0018C9BA89|nr:ABC transporter ATP-binding protein [Aureivirga sp. CE67]